MNTNTTTTTTTTKAWTLAELASSGITLGPFDDANDALRGIAEFTRETGIRVDLHTDDARQALGFPLTGEFMGANV